MTNYIKLLSCWSKLEYFIPAVLPKTSGLVQLSGGEVAPWEKNSFIPVNLSKIVYTVYLGVFPLSVVKGYGDLGNACYASLQLDNKGNYVENTFFISTLPWALTKLEKTINNNTPWEEEFTGIYEKLLTGLRRKLTGQQSIITLKEIQREITAQIGWEIKGDLDLYVQKEEITDGNGTGFNRLGSQFISDLGVLNRNFKEKQCSKAFIDYLKGCFNLEFPRNDVEKDAYLLKKELLPDNFPEGCWPSENKLKLMQQFVVNRIVNDFSGPEQEGIFSVNVADDDTRMAILKDTLAAIMVKRAKAMANYEDPTSAFRKVGQINVSDTNSLFVFQPDRQIIQGGIVITSPDTTSLQNITQRLSRKTEIAPYSEITAYFKKIAGNGVDKNNWGLFSAMTGDELGWRSLDEFLKKNDCTEQDWHDVSLSFFKKLNEVRAEKRRISTLVVMYNEYVTVKKEKEHLDKTVLETTEKLEEMGGILKQMSERHGETSEEKKRLLDIHTRIKEAKPGFWNYTFKKKVKNQYKKDVEDSYATYKNMSDELLALEHQQRKARNQKETMEKEFADLKSKATVCNSKYEQLKAKVELAKTALSDSYADNKFWDNIDSERSPWYSDELRKLQSELFILAMKVNETFILRANIGTNRLSATLNGFFEYQKNNLPATKEEIKAIWDVFLLLVPVVCAPLDSVQKAFSGLEQKDLPWIFIDRAGQLTPQAAAGIIWRSQRAVVMGDSQQMPSVVIPDNITNQLGTCFALKKDTVNNDLSAQTMADRANRYGYYVEDKWVGV